MLRSSLVAVAGLVLSLPGIAASQQLPPQPAPFRGPSFGFVLEAALEAGGDRVVETLFEDGTTQTMRAGQGGTVAIGGEIRPHWESPLALRATVGFKYVTTAATNVDITLTRVPIEVVGTYTLANDFRVGGGYVRHSAARFKGGGLGPDVDFEEAQGGTIELGWRWLALSYTMLNYTDEFGNRYDASSGGLSLLGTFRRR